MVDPDGAFCGAQVLGHEMKREGSVAAQCWVIVLGDAVARGNRVKGAGVGDESEGAKAVAAA